MSKLVDLGKRLDNISNYIKKDVPKDIWILRAIIPEFINDIKTKATEFEEQKMIEILNELLDQYEFRFNKTFENLAKTKVSNMKKPIIFEELSTRELAIAKDIFSGYLQKVDKFVDNYGPDAEKVAWGRAITLAKSKSVKDQQQRIKEAVKKTLSTPQIDSVNYIKTRKAVGENPIDAVTMDVPLLIRVMEFAKEDAKTDMDLHSAAENMIKLSQDGKILDMTDYDSITLPENQIDELVKKVINKLKS
jgi:hypothetical protein